MRLKSLPYTFKRYGNYYIQIRLSDGRSYKKSLSTDSYREASALMIGIIPHIPFVKSLATPIPMFDEFVSNLVASERRIARNPLLLQQPIVAPTETPEPQSQSEPENVLTLTDAWAMYKDERGRNWTKSISMANERYEDSQRYYFLIAEGCQGKTENATRQVVIHPKLIECGFMEYVNRQWKERIFSEVAGTNMTKIGKVFADLRDQLGIPYLDDYGQRRLLHSIRHSVCSASMAGWVRNILHLQQTVGHEKSGGLRNAIYIRSLYPRFVMLLMVFAGNPN